VVSVVRPNGTSPSIPNYSGMRSGTRIEPAGGSAVACNHGMQAETRFEDFMSELPKWRFGGSTLTLSTDRAEVELEPISALSGG